VTVAYDYDYRVRNDGTCSTEHVLQKMCYVEDQSLVFRDDATCTTEHVLRGPRANQIIFTLRDTNTAHTHTHTSSTGDPSPVCRDDGTYSAGATCEPIMCPPFTAPLHGSVTPSGPVPKGTNIHVECDPGYEPENPEAVDVICDGEWGDATKCVPVVCPPYKGDGFTHI